MTTTLTLLGAFRLEHDGRLVRLATRKVESLFGFLALHPEAHPREKLAALYWGDSTDEQARHSLRTALASIRKELGDDILLADRESVQLNPEAGLEIDVRAFERAADDSPGSSWLDSYADLLPDFYDDWILPKRERLRGIYIDTLLRVAQHHRERSEYAQAIQIAHKVLSRDLANEKAHQNLMFCYAAQGDRIAALKQYDECQKALRDELNAEPSSETTELRDRIMQELTGVASREAALTNLPHPLTSFIGREKELRELGELLAKSRLLTLTGAGGSGKTRLAIKVAREAVPEFAQGVWWVELAALSDPALVPQAVARVLGVQESREYTTTEMLTLFIRAKSMLIVLDNCEHLIEACAEVAERLLLACPHLKVLATSREALGLVGETVFQVSALSLPEANVVPVVADSLQYESVRLFVERARAAKSDFALTEKNAGAVVEICERLDGIPLALELAAARVKLLSLEHIAARLDDRFRLLTGGTRTALPRQQTLRATIDWSYDPLPEPAQKLFRRLSVFAGGWTLEAAEAVCSDDQLTRERVLDELGRLVDRSLVVVETANHDLRYRLLETIREYAREKLSGSEAEKLLQRHLEWYTLFAKEADSKLRSPQMNIGFKHLDVELENCRAALAWAFENNQSTIGTNLNAALLWYFFVRGYYREAKSWSEKAERLTRDASAATRGEALYALGRALADLGEYEKAESVLEQSLLLFRQLDNRMRIGWVLTLLGVISRHLGKSDQAEQYHQESLTLRRAIGDKWEIAHALQNLDTLPLQRGDYARAIAINEEGLKLSEELGDERMIARRLSDLGRIAFAQGDSKRADAMLKRSLSILFRMKERFSLFQTLESLAQVMAVEGQAHRAAQILGAIEFDREELGVILSGIVRTEWEQIIAELQGQLGAGQFAQAFSEGKAMTLEQAIEYALEQTT